MVTWMGPVATTAIQTIASAKSRLGQAKAQRSSNVFLDSCHTYASDSPVVKLHWPEHYNGDERT
jgi:hypothetical protein